MEALMEVQFYDMFVLCARAISPCIVVDRQALNQGLIVVISQSMSLQMRQVGSCLQRVSQADHQSGLSLTNR